MSIGTGCCVTADICRHLSLLFVIRHVLVFRDTSLGDAHGATRIPACVHCCSVAVFGLGAHGTLLRESEAVDHEHAITSGIDRVAIHELLLAPR